MKRALVVLFAGLLVVGPAWVLATETGLQTALAVGQRLTGGQLTVRLATGRLVGDVQLEGVAFDSPAVTVTIDRASLNVRLTRLLVARLQAEHLDVEGLAVTVHERDPPAAAEAREPLAVRAPLRMAVEEGRLRDFRLRLAGRTQDWVLPDARFRMHWRSTWFVIGSLQAQTVEAGALELRGRLGLADDQLTLADVELTGPGRLRLAGAVALTADAQSKLTASWERLRPPRPDIAPWFHSPHGEAELEGRWHDYRWRVAGHLHAGAIAGELAAHGSGNTRSVVVDRAEVKALDGRAQIAGRLEWSPALRTEATVQWAGIDPGAAFEQWRGRLNGEARLQARFGSVIAVDFDAAFSESQLRGYPFALQARGVTQDRVVQLQQFALQTGPSSVQGRGRLLPDFDLTVDVRSTDLASLWAGLSGRTELQATLRGSRTAPRITVRGAADDVVYQGYRVTHAEIDTVLDARGRSRVQVALRDVVAGVALREVTLTGGGTALEHELRLVATGSEGAASLALAGAYRRQRWQGHLADAAFVPSEGAAWKLEEPAAVTFQRGRFSLEPACLRSDASRACAEYHYAPGRQRLAFRTRDFDFVHLRAWLPAEWAVRGTLSGTAALQLRQGELAELRADLAASAGALEGQGVKLEFGPGSLRVQPDGDRLHGLLTLRPAGGEITGEVWIAGGGVLLDRPMLGDLRVHLPNLAWLPVLTPEIASAQGSVSAELHVSGTPRGPSLDGRLQVADGRVRLATPGIELTELAASFERGRNAPLRAHVEALSGGGRLTLDGELKSMQPRLAGTFSLRGDNVQGFNTPELRAWISPDFTLTLDGRRARLAGTLTVPRAELTPRELRRGGVGPSGDQVLMQERVALEEGNALLIESEVRIVLGDNVRFDGLGLKTQLTGGLTAYDRPGLQTTGRGELRLIGGRYKAYGQDLQIETGRLLFNGGPVASPAIDLIAFRQASEEVKVGLRARGTLDAPEFSLFSEPAMSQEDQLSWLVLGRPLSGTLSTSQRTELNSAALSLGLSGGQFLAQRLAPRLGFDEVSVGAKPGETTDLARFTIGKYLSPRLFVSYGVGLFQPGHFFRMQYDLGRRFKLVGESGVQQGGDILYSIER